MEKVYIAAAKRSAIGSFAGGLSTVPAPALGAAVARDVLSTAGVPVEKLWDRIPGVSVEEARAWREYREQNPSADERLSSALMAQANGADG